MANRKKDEEELLEGDTEVLEKTRLEEPKKYCVVLHNDDYTTQEFVVSVLMEFFQLDRTESFRVMMKVHLEGKARIGSYTMDIAESKVAKVTAYARQSGMPLLMNVEPLE